MKQQILEVSNVNKKVKDTTILHDVSFSLNRGEIVGLIGPNGAGKTSIMKILVGLTMQYEGIVQFKNVKNIGCMIETPSFYPYWFGVQNLNYFAKLNGVKKDRVQELLELLGLSNAAKRKVKNYSLGMRQRLGIAQALLTNPELLILDEPTNGLDPEGIYEMRQYIRKIAKENNITVLISSHLLSELEKLCDRAILIKKGELIDNIELAKEEESGKIRLVLESPQIQKVEELLFQNGFKPHKKKNGSLIVEMQQEQKLEVAKLLAANSVIIMGMYEETLTLENTFLEKIHA